MTSTIGAIGATDYSSWDVSNYSSLLEECTGWSIRQGTDREGEICYWLIDSYGDPDGDPFYEWNDVIIETVDAIESQMIIINGD